MTLFEQNVGYLSYIKINDVVIVRSGFNLPYENEFLQVEGFHMNIAGELLLKAKIITINRNIDYSIHPGDCMNLDFVPFNELI